MTKTNIFRLITPIFLTFILGACDSTAPDLIPTGTDDLAAISTQIVPATTPSAPPTEDAIDQLLSNLQATPVRFVYPTPAPMSGPDWRPPPYKAPLALRPEDHFYFRRPIPSDQVNWPHPQYRYGNTFFGELSIHTGVDLGAAHGTPVLAAGSGEVIWTGYGLFKGFDNLLDPYGLAIAIRHDFGFQGENLYTVYAHLSSINVWLGQHVEAGEKIGEVGNTGESSGDHLHFEVRLGNNDYFSTQNPELWMVPPEGWAILAGKVTSTYGLPLDEFVVEITNLETERVWNVWTYVNTVVNSDNVFDENFVISDLPAGPYEIRIVYYGVSFRSQLFLNPGQTNNVLFKGWDGFQTEATEIANLDEPPTP
jgi:murein DD-endopeptidase MepM/ murein hydrolase activator NlpD